jgi:hypothetical protein
VAARVDDALEDYLERFRRPRAAPPPLPPIVIGPRARLRARVRDALPRPVYEAAVGRAYYGARKAVRRNPGHGRMLPDFLIIGGAKCGTTSLYDWLSRHPQILPASEKEVHFFDYNFFRGEDWYRSHFARPLDGVDCVTGDGSVSYLSHRWAPERAARLLPHAKLIVVMRDPVDRAYSQFQMSRSEKLEVCESFEEAIAWEGARLRPELARIARDPRYNSLEFGVWSYLARSRYAEHLERWLDFFPREQFLFLRAEEMFADAYGAIERIDEFLGVPPHRPEQLSHLLDGGKYPPMEESTRSRLTAYFRPHNERLRQLTGIDLGCEG